MHYSVTSQGPLLEVRVDDGLTKPEILELWDVIERHPRYHEVTAGLVLCGHAIQWNLRTEDIRHLAKEVQRLRALPWAIVADDPLSFGMARMFALQTDDERRYRVFENESDARTWLKHFLPSENTG